MRTPGKELLQLLKEVAGTPGPQIGLKIVGFQGYFLRAVPTKSQFLDAQDIDYLTEWRNRHTTAFLTEFHAIPDQTARWLSETVHTDRSRILFMIENGAGQRVGYMGIACIDWKRSYVEADAIVSGGGTMRGLMSAALQTLLYWARGSLGLETVAVRVLSDNPALAFYRKLGFEEIKRVPLRRVVSSNLVAWIEDDTLRVAKRFLVHHLWNDQKS